MGYVVSKYGTFGTVRRVVQSCETGENVVVIEWCGPLNWISPVAEKDCKYLSSRYGGEAREEAKAWLASLELTP